jgi:hypothetical protein
MTQTRIPTARRRGPPMALGNMRAHGVRPLWVLLPKACRWASALGGCRQSSTMTIRFLVRRTAFLRSSNPNSIFSGARMEENVMRTSIIESFAKMLALSGFLVFSGISSVSHAAQLNVGSETCSQQLGNCIAYRRTHGPFGSEGLCVLDSIGA